MAKFDVKRIHSDRGALEQALRAAGATFKGKAVQCLWHDDTNPSGSVYQNDAGEWRFKCHACGVIKDCFDVQAFTQGRNVNDVLRDAAKAEEPSAKPRIFPTIEAMLESISHYAKVEDHYRYTNPETSEVDLVVVRCRSQESGKKSFLQARPMDGGWVQRAPNGLRPIFNRIAIKSASIVVLVEGEKCVKALRDSGWTGTTSPGGAQNGDKADWSPLAGKNVVLWPDNDTPGRNYMVTVSEQLAKLSPPPKVSIIDVEPLGLPEGGDCVEHLEKWGGATRESKFICIREVVESAQGTGPSAKVRKLIGDTITGKRYAVSWPWPQFDSLTNALLPASATMICGDPAASKSFFVLDAAMHWHREGIPFAVYQLEADEDGSHQLRALVQHTGRVELLDWRWIRENPDVASELEEQNRDFLDSFASRLWSPPTLPPTLPELTDWVNDRAKEGCRVMAIDPITAASATADRWNDDRNFVLNTSKIMRDHGCSLVVVTHPVKGAKGSEMSDLSLGAAFSRFTQTVVWIKAYYPSKEFTIATQFGGEATEETNRSVKIAKARLGRGTGFEIAYRFGSAMKFNEVGIVVKKRRDNSE